MSDKLSLDFPPTLVSCQAPAQQMRTHCTLLWLAKTTSHILPNRKKSTSCVMQPTCQWWWLICGSTGGILNTTPPAEWTYSQKRSMTVSCFPGYHFYHPDIGESSNHALHHRQPDFRLQRTSSLSSLLFVSILSNATPSWPRGKRSIVISSSHLQGFN